MKRAVFSMFCLAFAFAVIETPSAGAAPAPTDMLCPRAVPKLVSFNEAAATGDLGRIAEAARAVSDTYRACMAVASTGAQEPLYNYDRTRLAQYLVVLGRALAGQKKTAEALAVLKEARSEATDVADWTPASQQYHSSNKPGADGGPATTTQRNTDTQGSRYRQAAAQIRASADDELAKLSPGPSAPPERPH